MKDQRMPSPNDPLFDRVAHHVTTRGTRFVVVSDRNTGRVVNAPEALLGEHIDRVLYVLDHDTDAVVFRMTGL